MRAPAATAAPGLVLAGCAACGGALIAACFLRFALFPLAWLAFAPLLWAVWRANDARTAAGVGFVAGFVTNLPAFYWLIYTIHVFGGFGYPLSLFFYSALTLFGTFEFVIFALAAHRSGPGPLALAAPLFWVTLEFVYPNLFPWRLANSQFHAPVLLQIGDLTGPFGLSFVMVWFAAALVTVWRTARRWQPLAAASAAIAVVVLYGVLRLPQIDAAMHAAPSLRVALVQGNVGIKEKGDVRYFDVNLGRYEQLSEAVQDDVDLVVWPETVSQRWIESGTSRLSGTENPFVNLHSFLIFGGLAFRVPLGAEPEEFNSEFLMAADGVLLDRYDKHVLMPFGEYIPLASTFPVIKSFSPESSSLTPGHGVSVFDVPGKGRVGPLICYEDLLAPMARATTAAGAEVLLNILNDAWYGDSAAPYQHQALALWRAVENRRPLLRDSNSGITSVIDPAGRIIAEGGVFTAEVVRARVPRMTLSTFYTRHGDVFAWAVVIGAAALLGITRGQRRH